jgi:hypothetical protein
VIVHGFDYGPAENPQLRIHSEPVIETEELFLPHLSCYDQADLVNIRVPNFVFSLLGTLEAWVYGMDIVYKDLVESAAFVLAKEYAVKWGLPVKVLSDEYFNSVSSMEISLYKLRDEDAELFEYDKITQLKYKDQHWHLNENTLTRA